MKVTCPYCGSMINDTLETCPNCGSPNAAVRRKSGDQPMTVEELKEWYTARGLPHYETTRFFIGIDYRGPRAFGIYKEGNGNFVVYKNKDNGQRAVRYEGTDEAYAVNEIYLRLKQEILQQKQENLQQKQSNLQQKQAKPNQTPGEKKEPAGRSIKGVLWLLAGIFLGFPILMIAVSFVWTFIDLLFFSPADGYYTYGQTIYYYYGLTPYEENKTNWLYYDPEAEDWRGPVWEDRLPEELERKKTAKKYFLSEKVPGGMEEHSFFDSGLYLDMESDYTIPTGYYQREEKTYYHLYGDRYSGWYSYDPLRNDWDECSEVPPALTTNATAGDFFFTPTWDGSTQITDFTDTEYYENAQEEWDAEDDHDYDWDSGDSWDSDKSDWDSDW